MKRKKRVVWEEAVTGCMLKKKCFLTENVSNIVLHNTPTKFKDPGFPTLTCTIGKHLGTALIDLGSSVNILPFSVFIKLGLGEIKEKTFFCLWRTVVSLGRGDVLKMFWSNWTNSISP